MHSTDGLQDETVAPLEAVSAYTEPAGDFNEIGLGWNGNPVVAVIENDQVFVHGVVPLRDKASHQSGSDPLWVMPYW